MAFEEVEVGAWKPKEAGESIEGFLLKVEENVGTNNSNIYTLEVDKKPVAIWGSTILDPKMAAVIIGDKLKVQYDGLGEAKAGHNAPKRFKVFIDYDLREAQKQQ